MSDELTAAAKRFWDELTPELEVTGRNRALLIDYCRCLEQIERLEKRVRREGIILQGFKKQRIKNPAMQILRDYRSSAQNYARILGLGKVWQREHPESKAKSLLDGNWKGPALKGASIN